MKFTITPYKAKKEEENRVTSYNIFKKGERRISDEYHYDDKGIFSYKIFGKIGSCRCATDKMTHPGYCKVCETRVIDPEHIPFFYIDLEIDVPKLATDFKKYPHAEKLLQYNAFLAKDDEVSFLISEEKWVKKNAKAEDKNRFEAGEEVYRIYNLKTKEIRYEALNFDMKKFCKNKKLFLGTSAVKELYKDKELDKWFDTYITDYVYVPHTSQRGLLKMNNGKIIISDLNNLYTDLLYKIHITESYKMNFEYDEDGNNDFDTIEYYLASYRSIYEAYKAASEKILALLTEGKKSYLNLNLRSHRITSAIKGTVINRFDIDEDVVLIGDTFVQTLYPYLYKEFEGDMEQINQALIDRNEICLINRAPTICHLSIVAAYPRIASCYKFGTFDDGALGPAPYKEVSLIESEDEYDEEEEFDEIDTLGIRTVAINPIITDGIAGDFDGDNLLIIPIFSTQGKAEAETMLPSKNFMNFANGEIRNAIPEDIVYANSRAEEEK